MKTTFFLLVACASTLVSSQQASNNTTTTAIDNSTSSSSPNASNTTALPAANVTLVNGTAGNNATTTNTSNSSNLTSLSNDSKGSCVRFCRRREIRNLSGTERQAYFGAIKKLMEGSGPTKYDQIVKLHLDATEFAHGTANFLTWHRGYLYEFEKALQAIDPTICQPYWNWSVDSQAPETSTVLSGDYYGGNGGGSGGCVQDGQFAGWQPHYPQPHCLQRSFRYKDSLGAFNSFEGVNKVVRSRTTYNAFGEAVESLIHATPHTNLGGDMKRMHSTNDPLFWVHHAYIDYIFAQWQRIHSFSESTGLDRSTKNLGLSTTVAQVLDHRTLCYDYVDMTDADLGDRPLPPSNVQKPSSNQKPDKVQVVQLPSEDDRYNSQDRSNLNIVRYPDAADDEWLQLNKYDVTKVRGYEKEQREVYKQLNEIKGYVSPCSLWKRPSLCSALIQKKQKLYVDVQGYGRIVVEYESQDPYQAYSNVKQRVMYCTPDVEYPEEQYRKSVERLVGSAAFKGAGTLKKVGSEEDVSSSSIIHNVALTVALSSSVFFTTLL